MLRYLSTQYPTKISSHPQDRKGDIKGKKGDDSKSKDKDNNNTGTAGAHVGEVTIPQDLTAPSDGSSTGAHVSKVAEPEHIPLMMLFGVEPIQVTCQLTP